LGAWDESAFGNDTACDWAYELEGSKDLGLVVEALDDVLKTGNDYLDADVACVGLAACEVVARLKGNWGQRNAYTETVDKWIEAHAELAELAPCSKAVAVLDRILGASSELRELWEEEGPNDEWRSALAELRTRLA